MMEFADSACIRIKTNFLCKYIVMYFISFPDKQDMRIENNITACETASSCAYLQYWNWTSEDQDCSGRLWMILCFP